MKQASMVFFLLFSTFKSSKLVLYKYSFPRLATLLSLNVKKSAKEGETIKKTNNLMLSETTCNKLLL